MYEIKKQIYLDLSKTQKSALCNFLRALVKKSPELSVDNILNKFIEDERGSILADGFYPELPDFS